MFENLENPVAGVGATPTIGDTQTTPGTTPGTTPTTPGATPTTGIAGLDPSQSTLSANFAPYVNQMLEMGMGAATQPYQPYTGDRFAGPSELQQKAFTGIAGLGTPSQFDTATDIFSKAATAAGNLQYTPQATPSFSSVGAQNVTSDYRAPAQYQAATFQNLFQAPTAYQSADLTGGIGGQSYQGGTFDTQLGPVKSVQDYMSQYMTGVSDVSAREATRQADISRQAEQARLSQAGAYGGSRQAIMEAERQRNLGTQIGDIRTQGLQAAFDRAQQQRLAEAGMGMDAQKATEGSRQFGASFGQQGLEQLLRARQASEQSRQFGAQQGMTAAQLQAQYGLSAQQAQEASRQFGYGQQMTAAELQTRFGLDAQKANQMAKLQAETSNQQASLEAARQAEQSRQFGASYGLKGLDTMLQAGQGLGTVGMQQQQAGLQGLESMLRAGGTQQQFDQQEKDFGYQQFQESMKYPYQQATYMQSLLQGLPLQAPEYDAGGSDIFSLLQGGISGLALEQILNPKGN